MTRLAPLTLPLGLALALVSFAQEPAQGPIHIFVGAPGRQEVALALPRPVGGGAEAAAFYDTVKRDLELSGWFKIIDPAAYIEPAGTGIREGEFNYQDWATVGASGLAKTGLSAPAAGKLRAEVWVYDVNGASKIGAKAFTVDAASARTLAHRIAGEIIFLVTGTRAPFNTRFAFSGAFGKNKEIYLVDFDGQGKVSVTKNGSINLSPSWSPRGNAVAFTSYMAGNPDLYVADLSKGEIKRLSAREGLNTGASWSARGSAMALTLSPGGNPDIYTLDAATGRQLDRLTKEPGIDTGAAFSPDGSQVAFVSDRSGGAQIYVMDAKGGGVRRVTFAGGQNTDPAWSPDGKKLAFVSREGVFDVFTVNLDGTGLTRITQSAGDNEDPSWSPDGNYLAFASNRTGSYHIWMSTADGYHQAQLTTGGGGYMNPAWSPSMEW